MRVLAQQQVNIEELETDVTSAPMSGDTLFRARAHLRVPPSVTLDSLRSRLEALAGELMVDLTLDGSEPSADIARGAAVGRDDQHGGEGEEL